MSDNTFCLPLFLLQKIPLSYKFLQKNFSFALQEKILSNFYSKFRFWLLHFDVHCAIFCLDIELRIGLITQEISFLRFFRLLRPANAE